MTALWTGADSLVLASGSSIRSQLLSRAGIPHDALPATIDERNLELSQREKTGQALAAALARAKALDVSTKMPDRLILGADQTLTLGSTFFHKPESIDQARTQLLALAGKTHQLHAAIAVMKDGIALFETVVTANLKMRPFTDAFLDAYLHGARPEILTSVGCYHIEGMGIQLFERIDGDQFTIMGLPMIPLLSYFRSAGLILN